VARPVDPKPSVLFQNLDPEFIAAYRAQAESKSRDLPRRLDPQLLWSLATDENLPSTVRALAVGRLDEQTVVAHADQLLDLLTSNEVALVLATIRRLSALPPGRIEGLPEVLSRIALDAEGPTDVRCEALLALAQHPAGDPAPFVSLLEDADPAVAIETARTIRSWLDAGQMLEYVETIRKLDLRAAVRERLARAGQGTLFEDAYEQPTSLDDWRRAVAAGGDDQRGRRVFLSTSVGCTKCHTVDGRGGVLGPSLSRVAASKSRQQIIDAILQPSADFPPQYQAWIVMTSDGQIHRGLQLDHKAGGAIVLTLETGENYRFAADEIEEYAASPSSLMPDGLEKTMSVSEFQDLVTFLESLK